MEVRKFRIDGAGVQLLQSIFTQPQEWTTRQPETVQTRYDVFFPDRTFRQSLWGLGARLKVRRDVDLEKGGLLGVYPPGNDWKGGNSRGWKRWLSLVLWPTTDDLLPIVKLSWSGSYWCKNGPGLRDLRGSTDGQILVTCPGSSGRCARKFLIGPRGTNYVRTLVYPRAGDQSFEGVL